MWGGGGSNSLNQHFETHSTTHNCCHHAYIWRLDLSISIAGKLPHNPTILLYFCNLLAFIPVQQVVFGECSVFTLPPCGRCHVYPMFIPCLSRVYHVFITCLVPINANPCNWPLACSPALTPDKGHDLRPALLRQRAGIDPRTPVTPDQGLLPLCTLMY